MRICNHTQYGSCILHLSFKLTAKKEEYQSAVDSFERALDFAKLQEDDEAENAIKKALKEVNDKIAENAARGDQPKENPARDSPKQEFEEYEDDTEGVEEGKERFIFL